MKTAVVGYGYWGPNIARNLAKLSELKYICDSDQDRQLKAAADHQGVQIVGNINLILNDPEVEAVAIVTPPHTHARLAAACAQTGKHMFIEKPMAHTMDDADIICSLQANCPDLVMCVGHTFIFSPEIRKLKELMDDGLIGNVQTINIQRLNLGKYQECGIQADLIPHDVSILEYLTEVEPEAGGSCFASIKGVPSVGSVVMKFPGRHFSALLTMSWVHTEKVRKVIIVGDKGTIEYDMAQPHFIRHFEDRIVKHNQAGNMSLIEVQDHSEPLASEMLYWLNGIRNGLKPQDNIVSVGKGRTVAKVLENV
jgi:predicted dehydrogenase